MLLYNFHCIQELFFLIDYSYYETRFLNHPFTLSSFFLFGSFKFALCLGQLPPQIFDLSGQLLDVLVAVYEIRCLPYANFRRDFYFFLMN